MLKQPIKIKYFAGYLAVLILLMVLPINGKNSKINHTYILSFRLDYIFHVLLFLPWMFFKGLFPSSAGLLTWLIIGIFIAGAVETLQALLPYRSFNINDLAGNIIGVVFSGLFYIMIAKIKRTG